MAYKEAGARAACVLAESWDSAAHLTSYTCDLPFVAAYEPGLFYKRELPCLLAVLALLPVRPDAVVVDGYVWLSAHARPGLGAYLHEALGSTTPVVGIAKTAFHGADTCPAVAQVLRGNSARPLFVTVAGLDLQWVTGQVQRMAGPHRIPQLLTAADQLSRTV